jgi:hypothetical protein
MEEDVIKIDVVERKYINSLYALKKIKNDTLSKIEFLKKYTGYTNISGKPTPEGHLKALELVLISDM